MALSSNTSINHPYIPSTDSERADMLKVIGVDSFDDLITDIPLEHRHPSMDLASGLTEQELASDFSGIAGENASSLSGYVSFLGAGSYNHYVPSVVRSILQRGEFVTAYTPYQPEAAQGTLQVGFEFQTIICQLTGSESKETLDHFIAVMRQIDEEVNYKPELISEVPHDLPVTRLDEVTAARKPILRWAAADSDDQ